MSFSSLFAKRSFGMIRGGPAPIALDFGSSSIKVLQISDDDPPMLVTAGQIELPPELAGNPVARLEQQLELAPKLLRAIRPKGKRVMVGLPAAQTFCRHMQVAATSDAPVEAVVTAAVATELGCLPNAILCRAIVVEGAATATNGKTEVICLAAAKEVVRRIITAVKSAGFSVVGIHPEAVALSHGFESVTRREGDAELCSVYLDLGYGATRVVVAHGRRMVFSRIVQMGWYQVDQAVAQRTGVSLAQARAERIEASRRALAAGKAIAVGGGGESEDEADDERRVGRTVSGLVPTPGGAGQVCPETREYLESLVDEVAMCLRYHRSMFPQKQVERAIFVGGEATIPGVCGSIARALGLPAQVADPMARVGRKGDEPLAGVQFDGPRPGWATAIGLCGCPAQV